MQQFMVLDTVLTPAQRRAAEVSNVVPIEVGKRSPYTFPAQFFDGIETFDGVITAHPVTAIRWLATGVPVGIFRPADHIQPETLEIFRMEQAEDTVQVTWDNYNIGRFVN